VEKMKGEKFKYGFEKKTIKFSLESGLHFLILISIVIFSVLLGATLSGSSAMSQSTNVTNQTVLAKVNVSNTEPTLFRVELRVNGTSAPPIDPVPNEITLVICNGSFTDPNGFDDIVNVSATFFEVITGSNAADDNNNHYTNDSCGACTVTPNSDNNNGSCLCQFPVQYYANSGNWQCNMTINDTEAIGSTLNSSVITLNGVIGIDVETAVIDYGNLSVLATSDPIRENVTNTGNIPINITVRGYGGDNESTGENVSMVCDSGSNITFDNSRYYPGNNTPFSDMYNLTNQTKQIFNLTIPQRTDDVNIGNSSNSTFWRLYIPLGPVGLCNGTIIFGGVDAS
jgi:hypothetical protein